MVPNIRNYAAKQGLITGICTFALCAILFLFLVKAAMPVSAIGVDLALTVGPTGFICGLLQLFLTKGPVQKGLVPPAGKLENQAAYLLVPKNGIAFLVLFTVVELLLFAFAPAGILAMIMGGGELSRFAYIVFKGIMAACAGGYATYHANIFVCGLYQEKLQTAAK